MANIIKLSNNNVSYLPVTIAEAVQYSYGNNEVSSVQDVLGYIMNRINNIPILPETPDWNPYMPFYTIYHIKFVNNGQYYEGFEQTFNTVLSDTDANWQNEPNTSGLIDAIISGSYYDVTKTIYTDLSTINGNLIMDGEPVILDSSYFNITHGLDELVGKMIPNTNS